jgi:hypothetical protein
MLYKIRSIWSIIYKMKNNQPINDFDFLEVDNSESDEEKYLSNSNPFFLAMDGSSYKYVKTKQLATECNRDFFIMCLGYDAKLKDREKNLIGLFHDPESDFEELKGQSSLVTIVKAPFFLINIPSIRAGLIKVNSSYLRPFSNYEESYFSSPHAFVYLMLESTETEVNKWLLNYQCEDNLDEFIRQKAFTIYNNLNDSVSNKMLISYITKVTDFTYWENESNCKLSINKAFDDRRINLRMKWKLPVDEIERIAKEFGMIDLEAKKEPAVKDTKTIQPARSRPAPNSTTTYPTAVIIPEEKKWDPLKINVYVDASKSDQSSYFQISTPEDRFITQETVRELLLSHSLNLKEKYYLVSNLLISKNYAHYVVGDPHILSSTKQLFLQFKPIFRYLMSYAFVTLYKEESALKTRATKDSRCIFRIECASQLPVFPFATNSPHLNPYFPLLLEKRAINAETNINSIKSKFRYQAGIVDLAEFKRRLNIFISGDVDLDLMGGADWSHMAVTGGSMAAIMPKINPLMALFKSDFNVQTSQTMLTPTELNRYFTEYYSESDIDIACNHANFFDFIEHVKSLKQIIVKNGSIKPTDIEIKPVKTVCLYINVDLLRTKCQSGEIPFSYDYAVGNKNCHEVKHFFYEIYLREKFNSNMHNKTIIKDRINDPLYYIIIDYVHLDDVTIIFRDSLDKIGFGMRAGEFAESHIKFMHALNKSMEDISERADVPPEDIFIKTIDTIKYKIISNKLKHSFEVFRIDYPDFFSTIARFHFPCVRAYYDGTTCYMSTSAIVAYMTMCNIDYKFFSGSNDPISIIHKYRQRGYASYFNRNEVNQIVAYTLTNSTIRSQYGLMDNVTTVDGTKIVGPFSHQNVFFQPRKSLDTNNYLDPGSTYETETKDIIDYYTQLYPKCSSSIFTQSPIDIKGNMEPVKRWMMDMVYDLLKQD